MIYKMGRFQSIVGYILFADTSRTASHVYAHVIFVVNGVDWTEPLLVTYRL